MKSLFVEELHNSQLEVLSLNKSKLCKTVSETISSEITEPILLEENIINNFSAEEERFILDRILLRQASNKVLIFFKKIE